MAYEYRVVPLSESGGLPVVNGAAFVSAEIEDMFVAYGPAINRRHTTLAILYKDNSGRYLVGAESSVFGTLPAGDTLDNVIDNDPGDWRTYRFAHTNGGDGYAKSRGFGDIPPGILVALSVGAPLPLALMPDMFQGLFNIIGLQGSATHRMADFIPSEIETGTTFYGDTV